MTLRHTRFAATAAAAAALASGPAPAAEPLVATVTGYMEGGVSVSGKEDGVGVLRDGEVQFAIKGTAENGLVFGAQVELEATTAGDQIDENFVYVQAADGFWQLMIGGNDDAKDGLISGVARFTPISDQLGYYDDNDVAAMEVGGIDSVGDAPGVHLTVAPLAGLTLRAGFTADDAADGASDSGSPVFEGDAGGDQAFHVAGRFKTELDGGLRLGVGVGYIIVDGPGDPDSLGVAGEIGFGGFGVRGYWEENFDGSDDYALGAQYETGAWTFAGGWSQGGKAAIKDTETIGAWVAYALVPGVTTTLGVQYADGATGDNTQGTAWINVQF